MSIPTLAELRAQIDALDADILAKLSARARCAQQVGDSKRAHASRLLPPRTRAASAGARRRPERRPPARPGSDAAVPRNHVRLPRPGTAAGNRLSRPGRHLHPGRRAQTVRPFRAHPADALHRRRLQGGGKRRLQLRRRPGRKLHRRHGHAYPRQLRHLAPLHLRRSAAAHRPEPPYPRRHPERHPPRLFAQPIARPMPRLARRKPAGRGNHHRLQQCRSGQTRCCRAGRRGDCRQNGGRALRRAAALPAYRRRRQHHHALPRHWQTGEQPKRARQNHHPRLLTKPPRPALQTARTHRPPRHQHDPHRIAAKQTGHLGIHLLHRP